MTKYEHANPENMPQDSIFREDSSGDLQEINLHTGEIVEVSSRTLPMPIKYSPEAGELVCHFIRSGCTLQKAAELADLPHENSIYAWKRKSEDFKIKIQDAQQDRADKFRDKFQELAEQDIIAKDQVPGVKLKGDMYKDMMGWDNKEKYGTKHVASTHSGALQLVITTGIDRSPKNEPKNVCSGEIDNKEEHASTGEEL